MKINVKNIEKKMQVSKKNAEICGVEILKNISLHLETIR